MTEVDPAARVDVGSGVHGPEEGYDVVRRAQIFTGSEGDLVGGQPRRRALGPVSEDSPDGRCLRRPGRTPRTYWSSRSGGVDVVRQEGATST